MDAEFTAFVRSAYPRLLRTAYLLTGEPGMAEDLVQTVLARLFLRWERLAGVRDRDALIAYARTALARQSISWWRRAWHREHPTGELPEPRDAASGTDPLVTLENRDLLVHALAQLPPRQRAAVVLRYFDDLTETATAAAMGCSVGTVRAHTSRGITRLRDLMTAGPTTTEGAR